MTQHRRFSGLISLEIPLISNLDVWNNIALIKLYRDNLPIRQAKKMVIKLLMRYGLEGLAYKRSADLTDEQKFCIMLLRAAMISKAILVIDRPFIILHNSKDSRFMENALDTIDDLYNMCHILDYAWNENRYVKNDAE
jgi:ABC-type uncharacterized transport system YnjBCD ATPase subunit